MLTNRRQFLMMGVLPGVLLATGCGGAGKPDAPPPVPSSTAELKARLEDVVKYGGGGSALFGIKEGLEVLRKTDEAKANRLLKEYQKLDAQATPEGRRKQAQVMIDLLTATP